MNEEDFDEIIEQPLFTEDGFVNEACLSELSEAIKNMPKTHDRLAGDEEWSRPQITHFREITAALAYWAIRQIPDEYREKGQLTYTPTNKSPRHMPNLEKVISFLHECIRPKFDEHGYANLSLCDVSEMLHGILYEQGVSHFDEWNQEEVVGRFWLDLDALLHNVCLSIRQDRRESASFLTQFEAKHGKLGGSHEKRQ